MPSTLQPTNLELSSSKDANLLPSSLTTTDCEPSDSEAETTVSIDEKVYLEEKKKYLHIFRFQEKDGSRNHVYCKLCEKYPEIVRRFCESNRTPTITTTIGIRYKKKHVWAHFSSEYHKQCKAAEKATAKAASNLNRGLMDVHIKEANRKLANHVGELLLHVYCDAKKLTLSAYNWPARFVAAKAGQNFDFVTSTSTIPNTIDIQYVNPVHHLDFLETITQSHREEFMEQI